MKTTLAYLAIVAAFVVTGMVVLAQPAAAAEAPNWMDRQAFAYWEHQRAQADEVDALQVIDQQAERRPILPPVHDWSGNIRACEPENNPPEWMTRFGGFCQQIAYPDRQSLIFQGEDAIFHFTHH